MVKTSPFILTFLMVVVGLIGCKQPEIKTDKFITVDVTASYPKKELILQDFMDVEYIPLETNDEFITAANMRAIGKDIMIFTNMRVTDGDIFIFDRKGKGLRKINRRGQGVGEYRNMQSVVLDEENDEMYVNSTYSQKIFVYDLLGNFKRSFGVKEDFTLSVMGNFDRDNLIYHDSYFITENGRLVDKKRNCFLLVSKHDGRIVKEIPIPYEDKKSTIVFRKDANGKLVDDRGIHNRRLFPYRDSWILTEISADTIYRYSPDHELIPFIIRTPSVQSMTPEVLLYPGIQTDRYYFMQAVKKEYDFSVPNSDFPRTELVYDRQENAIFECAVYNDDFTTKKTMNMVWEHPMFVFVNNEIAMMKKIDAYELVEALEKGELKGKLKEIATTLDEESNPVIMLAKYKK